MNPPPVFLTPQEVAARLRVSKMFVYRAIHEGTLPAFRVGRQYRIPETAANEYLRDAKHIAGGAA